MFTRFTRPHYVQHPEHGWLAKGHECEEECAARHGQLSIHLTHAEFVGGKPADPKWPHWVEADVSTGLTGCTRLTAEEKATKEAAEREAARSAAEKQRELDMQAESEQKAKDAAVKLLREKAATDPAIAAMLKVLGL